MHVCMYVRSWPEAMYDWGRSPGHEHLARQKPADAQGTVCVVPLWPHEGLRGGALVVPLWPQFYCCSHSLPPKRGCGIGERLVDGKIDFSFV